MLFSYRIVEHNEINYKLKTILKRIHAGMCCYTTTLEEWNIIKRIIIILIVISVTVTGVYISSFFFFFDKDFPTQNVLQYEFKWRRLFWNIWDYKYLISLFLFKSDFHTKYKSWETNYKLYFVKSTKNSSFFFSIKHTNMS